MESQVVENSPDLGGSPGVGTDIKIYLKKQAVYFLEGISHFFMSIFVYC
jgi:hypothetical protein